METRYALPYISHLRVTKRPTQNWVAAGYQNKEGQDLYKQVTDLPGIEAEITPYMGTVKGPATQFRFPSKAFFETALAEVSAQPVAEQTLSAKTNIEATLARTDLVWCESILLAGGLPILEDLWADVFSDALDEFEVWKEPDGGSGIPLEVKEMQWDARIPADGPKQVTLKTGLYITRVVDGKTVTDYSIPPTITTLQYEDRATRKQRLEMMGQINDRITQLVTELAGLPDGPKKKQVQADLDRMRADKAQRIANEIGSFPDLLKNPSVQKSLPALIMAINEVVKEQNWPTLDMAVVHQKVIANLTAMMA